jgi:hypothetical protein
VDVDELRAHAVLLEVVVGPKVHERQWATVNSSGKRRWAKKHLGQRR